MKAFFIPKGSYFAEIIMDFDKNSKKSLNIFWIPTEFDRELILMQFTSMIFRLTIWLA